VLVNEPCQDGRPQTKRVLCVLLLQESTMWWCLKVSLVRLVFRLLALLRYSTSDLTRFCLQYTPFFPSPRLAGTTEAEHLFIFGGAPAGA
jgi:hypothetical protein